MSDQYILGISAFYHDSAACLLRDGEIVAAGAGRALHAEEGRRRTFRAARSTTASRRRAFASRDLDVRRLLRQAAAQVRAHPRDLPRRRAARVPVVPDGGTALDQGEAVHRPAAAGRSWATTGEILYAEHHESHAASAFFPSPFEEAAILTMDGVGEWATASIGVGTRQRHRDPRRAALARLARPALLGVHLLHRLQGQLRRVQGDGPRAVRRAEVRRPHLQAS